MSLFLFNQNTDEFISIMLNNDLNKFIKNTVGIEMGCVSYADKFLPLTVCHSPKQQAWVVSPLSTYIDYAQEETLRHVPKPWNYVINTALSGLKKSLQWGGFSNAVILNNWLVSTNLYPEFDQNAVNMSMNQVLKRYPHHALWWRSLNRHHHAAWLDYLQQQGCLLIPSRRIFLLDRPALALQEIRDWKNDLRLQRQTPLQLCHNNDIHTQEDYATITERYNQLYLTKYSHLNPHYTAHFIQTWHQAKWLHLQAWKDQQGVLQGVAGSIHNQQQLTTPIFGFNTDLPQKMGLYRLNNMVATQYAIENNLALNLSAGAGHFKQNRGAVAHIEYSAVYAKHLPAKQQATLKWVQAISQYIGQPMLEKMDL